MNNKIQAISQSEAMFMESLKQNGPMFVSKRVPDVYRDLSKKNLVKIERQAGQRWTISAIGGAS